MLRLVTAGSVDDGKSTLIGRLLYDSQSVYEDQLHAVQRASRGGLELALLTDGLRAEREQGITIDVAYRYFSTAKRKFILADTPGHEQYTRNMATGASNADLAMLLVDASRGIQRQSKRHAYIVALLGIRHLVVLINKMDLVDYSEQAFHNLQNELLAAIDQLDFESVEFFPVSASSGMNVVHRSSLTPWFLGPPLLEYLESVGVDASEHDKPFRFPVQLVQRTDKFRGYSGQIAAGSIAVGDSVSVLPSMRSTRVKAIVGFEGELERAVAPQSITITVEDDLDISRGDVFAAPESLPFRTRNFKAQTIWFSERQLSSHGRYLLKHTTQMTPAEIVIESKMDIASLSPFPADSLQINDIGVVEIETSRPLLFDSYKRNRVTGSFILIDPATNDTVAAGMILEPVRASLENTHGMVASMNRDDPRLQWLMDSLHSFPKSNVAVLFNRNAKAIGLLTNAGIHVVVVDNAAENQQERSNDFDELVSALKPGENDV